MFGANYGSYGKQLELNYSFVKSSKVELVRPLKPRRCYISKKLLWLTPAYKVTKHSTIYHTNKEIVDTRWYHKTEFLLLILAGRS